MGSTRPGRPLARGAQALLLVALAARLAPDARAVVPGEARKAWFEVRTRNFTVFAPSQGDASDAARRLERLREVMIATHPTLDAAIPPVVRVYAFGSAGPLRIYGSLGAEHAAGYNVAAEDGDLIAFDAGAAESDRTRYLQHEYVHSIVRHNLVRIPTWLDEGLAEYYSTFTASGSSASIGRTVPQWLAWLRGTRLMTLDQLFAITTNSPDYQSGLPRKTFYAESWALVHFLSQTTPDRAQRFERFVARLRLGHLPLEAFTEVAPRERWPALVHDLEAYCGQSTFSYGTYTFATPFEKVPEQVRSLSHAETLCRLGELAEQDDDPDHRLAEEHFRAAVAADSLAAEPIAHLGCLLDRRGDTIHAESLYTAAGELAPRDARIWTLAARGAFRRFNRARTPAASSGALEVSRVRYAHAIQLDPGNLEALIGYGTTYRDDPAPPATAARTLTAASVRLPARIDVACDLALMLTRMGRCGEADSVFRERIEGLGGEPVVASVRQAVADCAPAVDPGRPH